MPEILKDKKIISVAAFAVFAIVMLLVSVFVLKCPVVAACIMLVLEVGIAVFLHNAELWLHGAFAIVEVIAGLLAGKLVLLLVFLLVYCAATVALKFSK